MLLVLLKNVLKIAFALVPTFYHNVEIDNFVSDSKGITFKYITYKSELRSLAFTIFGTNMVRCEKVNKINCFFGRKPNIYINIIKYQIYRYAGGSSYIPIPVNAIFTKAIDAGNYYYICGVVESGEEVYLSNNRPYVGDNNPSFILLEIKQICR